MTAMSTYYTFPDNFKWGAAASATQTEGASQQDGKAKTFGIIGLK